MNLKLEPNKLNRIFALSKEIVDEHINFVSLDQIKAILFVSRNNGNDYFLSDLAKDLKKSEKETEDILDYWIQNGFIICDNKISSPEIVEEKQSIPKTLPDVPYIQPTYDQVAARLSEDENLQALFSEAQKILGKTLGYDAQAKIIMMYDSYGLPIEVILCLISFCKSVGKSGINQICKIGQRWATQGIVTLEDAIDRMDYVKLKLETWDKFCEEFKDQNIRRTDNRVFLLIKWTDEYKMDFSLIKYAFTLVEDTEHRLDFKYIDGILKDWNKRKIKTVQAAQKDNLLFKSRYKNVKGKTEKIAADTSYDLEKFTDKNKNKITYKRRKT